MTTTIKTKSKVTESSNTAVDSVSRSSIITMGVASGLVGLWAVACLISAMVDSGPIEMIRNWFGAVLGM
jgi:hypothetical protein